MRGATPPREIPRSALSGTAAARLAEAPDLELQVHPTLPRDHPAWQRDLVCVSSRARAVIARLRPLAILVLSFWDHAVRAAMIGERRFEVDPSGCYRLR